MDKNIDNFSQLHPSVSLIYFILVILITMLYMNPVSLCISFLGAIVYSCYLSKGKSLKTNLFISLPTIIIGVLINGVINHNGETVLFYIRNTKITLEAIIYGGVAGLMLSSVIIWFSNYNIVITSDKIIYLFGKILPTFSLVFSLILNIVPRYKKEMQKRADAQKSIGRSYSEGDFSQKFKNATSILFATIAFALEDSIITAQSMKSRGYGLEKRTSYSIYNFYKKDKVIIIFLIIVGGFILFYMDKNVSVEYFPIYTMNNRTDARFWCYMIFVVLCGLPVIINILEELKWRIKIQKAK